MGDHYNVGIKCQLLSPSGSCIKLLKRVSWNQWSREICMQLVFNWFHLLLNNKTYFSMQPYFVDKDQSKKKLMKNFNFPHSISIVL